MNFLQLISSFFSQLNSFKIRILEVTEVLNFFSKVEEMRKNWVQHQSKQKKVSYADKVDIFEDLQEQVHLI